MGVPLLPESAIPETAATDTARRVRVRVRGQVQGVGFRPFVYHLARRRGLRGYVLNDAEGVLVEAEGEGLDGFLAALAAEAPPLACITAIEAEAVPSGPPSGAGPAFTIRENGAGGKGVATAIGPDAATCPLCLAELFDPAGRRYRYPFLNCTRCGPRYTITRRLPYDRASTSMAGFPLCPDCAREFADPGDRRFHAQPIACPVCGPRLSMPAEDIQARLLAGGIVAVKGIGGFHLACDARNEAAVAALRRRKRREEKPFAVMAADLDSVRGLVLCDAAEASVLESPARPILLLPRRPDGGLAPSVAPGLAEIGVMLPYAPLHHLLFAGAPGLALVMTSANPGGEPLVAGNDEAAFRLAGIADAIATHDRDILVRADDSVMRFAAGAPRFLRRARGFVPAPVRLARKHPPVLAVGGHLKSTLCVIREDEAFVSQHLGDLDNAAAIAFFEETAAHLLSILEVTPVAVAHDLHPDFASTRFAGGLGLPMVGVQHHHAHIAAILAEHRIERPVLGLALDGSGLGPKGESWGGELLLVDGARFTRLGHLAPLAQPGGDAASRAPWRMAAAALHRLGRGGEIAARFAAHGDADGVARLLERRIRAPETTSCGRLFDAAAGLLGVSANAAYEGQAPMLLEALVREARILDGGWRIGGGVLDLAPLLEALIDRDPAEGAALFHGTLAAALTAFAAGASAETGLRDIVLGGGCLLNRVLAEALVAGLAARGLNPLLARALPPNDGGLSLGQAHIAALTLEQEA